MTIAKTKLDKRVVNMTKRYKREYKDKASSIQRMKTPNQSEAILTRFLATTRMRQR